MACREQLLASQRQGRIELPPPGPGARSGHAGLVGVHRNAGQSGTRLAGITFLIAGLLARSITHAVHACRLLLQTITSLRGGRLLQGACRCCRCSVRADVPGPRSGIPHRYHRPRLGILRPRCPDQRFQTRQADQYRLGFFVRIRRRRRHGELDSCPESRVKWLLTMRYLGSYHSYQPASDGTLHRCHQQSRPLGLRTSREDDPRLYQSP